MSDVWKKHGIKISHFTDRPKGYPKNEERVVVNARHPDHGNIARAEFIHFINKKEVKPLEVGVDKDHRRKGIATAMYCLAEEVTKSKMIESDDSSEEARLFWNQNNRKFGKL